MTDQPEKVFESLLSTNFFLTTEPKDWRLQLIDEIREIKSAVNDKSIGRFSTLETYSGETFFKAGGNNAKRYLFRKVIDFGALPNATAKSVTHGITVGTDTYFIKIYGAGNGTNFVPIPYVDINTPANGIELLVDATNVTISSNVDWSGYTAYIVLEYLKY